MTAKPTFLLLSAGTAGVVALSEVAHSASIVTHSLAALAQVWGLLRCPVKVVHCPCLPGTPASLTGTSWMWASWVHLHMQASAQPCCQHQGALLPGSKPTCAWCCRACLLGRPCCTSRDRSALAPRTQVLALWVMCTCSCTWPSGRLCLHLHVARVTQSQI